MASANTSQLDTAPPQAVADLLAELEAYLPIHRHTEKDFTGELEKVKLAGAGFTDVNSLSRFFSLALADKKTRPYVPCGLVSS